MSTELEKLKHYMYPFYQASSDTSVLEWHITEYTYADVAASRMWANIPFNYDVQRFKTGAEETVYANIKDIGALCKERVKFYEEMVSQRENVTSVMARVVHFPIARGIHK